MAAVVFPSTMVFAVLSLLGSSYEFPSPPGSQAEIQSQHVTPPPSVTTAQSVIGCDATLTASNPNSQINYRSGPSTSHRAFGYGLVGDCVTILESFLASDGYTWHRVEFHKSPHADGWVRGDLVSRRSGPEPRIQLDRSDDRSIPVNRLFDRPQIDYFLEVALGSEYGNSGNMIRRWGDDICVNLNFPDAENIEPEAKNAVRGTVETVVGDINGYFKDIASDIAALGDRLPHEYREWEPITIAIAGDGCNTPNIEFYYVQAENFERYDPNARRGQVGHVWTWWNQNEINRSRILVSSNYLTDEERDHVIREELTQSLGILKDSWDYPSSIFYQGWTSVTRFDPMDEAVIKMLYHPAINPGMTSRDAEQILSQL